MKAMTPAERIKQIEEDERLLEHLIVFSSVSNGDDFLALARLGALAKK